MEDQPIVDVWIIDHNHHVIKTVAIKKERNYYWLLEHGYVSVAYLNAAAAVEAAAKQIKRTASGLDNALDHNEKILRQWLENLH